MSKPDERIGKLYRIMVNDRCVAKVRINKGYPDRVAFTRAVELANKYAKIVMPGSLIQVHLIETTSMLMLSMGRIDDGKLKDKEAGTQ